MRGSDHLSGRTVLAGTIVAAYALMFVCLAASKIRFDFAQIYDAYIIAAALLALSVYVRWLNAPRLSTAFDVVAASILAVAPISIWSYAAMGVAMPLADAELSTLDAAIGFDWRSFIAYVDQRPLLAAALHYSYNSFVPQLFLVPIYFALVGEARHAYAIVFTYILLCLISSVVSVWFPAYGTYHVYGVTAESLSNIDAKYGYFFIEQFLAVREAASFELILQKAAGLLTFPSVHAGVAGLCAWAAWRSRPIRYPMLILNAAMAIAAVSHANHYFVDVIAGLVIASFVVVVAKALFERPSRRVGAASLGGTAPDGVAVA